MAKLSRQGSQGAARIEMRLVGKEQGTAEPARERRLQPGDGVGIEPLKAFGALGEARQVGGITRLRHDQTSALLGTCVSP